MLTLIVARARNGAIGKGGDIPWHIPEDLALFKRETLGGAVIMGRKTWDSLPFKPLKNRLNIVVSKDRGLAENVVGSVKDALTLARATGYYRAYGIGGEGIYSALLPKAQRLLITEVDLEIDGADAFFPAFDEGEWREMASVELNGTGPECRVRELLKKARE